MYDRHHLFLTLPVLLCQSASLKKNWQTGEVSQKVKKEKPLLCTLKIIHGNWRRKREKEG
jgi:hypothetical protein